MRGPSARGYLRMDWDYPVYTPPEKEGRDGRSSAAGVRRALPIDEALKALAGDDPRPLLVLRECKVCNGTDDALLKGGVDNEKTYLLARWFHCVKLPADVLEEDHPFHSVFSQKTPEHLFVSSADGSNHDPLESDTSRKKLWDSMRGLIAKEYKSKPDSAIKSLAKLLDKLDLADTDYRKLVMRKEEILEKDGPRSSKLGKVQKKLDKAEALKQSLIEDFQEATDKVQLKKATKKTD